LTGKEEKSKLIVGRSGKWRRSFDFKRFSTVEDYMPIRIRRLDKLPIHCNMLIQKEMPAQIFGFTAGYYADKKTKFRILCGSVQYMLAAPEYAQRMKQYE
jgi:hypothetical protein